MVLRQRQCPGSRRLAVAGRAWRVVGGGGCVAMRVRVGGIVESCTPTQGAAARATTPERPASRCKAAPVAAHTSLQAGFQAQPPSIAAGLPSSSLAARLLGQPLRGVSGAGTGSLAGRGRGRLGRRFPSDETTRCGLGGKGGGRNERLRSGSRSYFFSHRTAARTRGARSRSACTLMRRQSRGIGNVLRGTCYNASRRKLRSLICRRRQR